MARQQGKRTGRVNTTLELHFDNIMTLLADAVANGDPARFGLSEALRLEQLARLIRGIVNERDGRDSVWIGGKVIGIAMPPFENVDAQMAWEEKLEAELDKIKGYQSFEIASGARPCYFIEFDEDLTDQEYISAVEKAIQESLKPAEEEESQCTPIIITGPSASS